MIVAAFLWQKSPKKCISTLIFDVSDLTLYSKPKKFTFSNKLFSFRKETKIIIDRFTSDIKKLSHENEKIWIEYKIVFLKTNFYWMKPAPESKIVYNLFIKAIKKIKNKNIVLQPQLRRRLSGNYLRLFKRELKKMELVKRNKNSSFEYHLWTVALHVTEASYKEKIKKLRDKLIDSYWNKSTFK